MPALRDLIDAELVRRGVKAPSDWADAPDDLPELARLAARLEPRLARIFRRIVGQARARVTLEQLEVAVGAGNAHAAAALFEDAGLWTGLTPEMRRELTRAVTTGADAGVGAGAAIGVDLSTAFDLVNPHAVEWAYNRTNEFVVEVSEAQRMALRDIVGQAVSGATDVQGAARLIRDVVGLTSRQAGAVENFRDRLIGEGVSADAVERRTEKYAAAQLRQRSQCLAGDTFVSAAVVRAVFRRWYEGPMIFIRTAAGRKFSATPNHPMLTQRGWVSAGLLNTLDDLVCDARQQNMGSRRDGNVKTCPATLREIFDSVSRIGSREVRPVVKADFHGDGTNSEVYVFRPDGELTIGRFVPLDKPTIQAALSPADLARFSFCNFCYRLLAVNQPERLRQRAYESVTSQAVTDRPCRDIQGRGNRGGRFPSSVAILDVRDRQSEWFRAAAPRQARDADDFGNVCLTHADDRCNPPRREAPAIEFDRVALTFWRESWRGHVFNLSTSDGYYNADGVFTGNTIARTEILDATNQGQQALWEEAKRQGLLDPARTRRIWLVTHDDRLDIECERLDGETASLDAPFKGGVFRPPLHPRCFVPSTRIVGISRAIAGLKANYSGPIVTVETRRGYRLTVTPQHPILTPCGWVAADCLSEGDHVLSERNRFDGNLIRWTPQDQDRPAVIEQVVNALRRDGFRSVKIGRDDLHGDAIWAQREVEIVGADRILWDSENAPFSKGQTKSLFVPANVGQASRPALGSQAERRERDDAPSIRAPCVSTLTLDGAAVSLQQRPLEPLSLVSRSWSHASGEQPGADCVPRNAIGISQSLFRRSGDITSHDSCGIEIATPARAVPLNRADYSPIVKAPPDQPSRDAELARDLLVSEARRIELDRIISVQRDTWWGHVYDLQTRDGFILAEGIVASNCRCAVGLVIA